MSVFDAEDEGWKMRVAEMNGKARTVRCLEIKIKIKTNFDNDLCTRDCRVRRLLDHQICLLGRTPRSEVLRKGHDLKPVLRGKRGLLEKLLSDLKGTRYSNVY